MTAEEAGWPSSEELGDVLSNEILFLLVSFCIALMKVKRAYQRCLPETSRQFYTFGDLLKLSYKLTEYKPFVIFTLGGASIRLFLYDGKRFRRGSLKGGGRVSGR